MFPKNILLSLFFVLPFALFAQNEPPQTSIKTADKKNSPSAKKDTKDDKKQRFKIKMLVADRFYSNYEFVEAAKHYKEIAEKDTMNLLARERLAMCYRKLNDSKNAEKWFFEVTNFELDSAYWNVLYYAQALAMNGKHEDAKEWYTVYSQLIHLHKDSSGYYFVEAYNDLQDFYKNAGQYDVKLAPFNSIYADFSPAFFEKGVVFCSNRTPIKAGDPVFAWNNTAFLDLYYSNEGDSTSRPFSGKLNTKYHEGPLVFYNTQDSAIFTRNNYHKGKYRKSKDGTNKLKLYFSHRKGGNSWGNIEEFPYNSDEYSIGHPALSTDNTTLYFVSDMQGTLGGTDIFRCRYENGKWSEPENLGKEINTTGNEMFPFIDQNNDLYFASNGLTGLGGLDLFMAKNVNGKFTNPENMGAPINTVQDDFALIIDDQQGIGYFSSNRQGGVGDDDIYYFKIKPKELILIAYNKKTNEILCEVETKLTETPSSRNVIFAKDNPCSARFKISLNTGYDIVGKKTGFSNGELDLLEGSVLKLNNGDTVRIYLEPDQPPVIEEEPKPEIIAIKNVYYDFDKYNIRRDASKTLNEVLETLKANPRMRLLLSAHTDSRASYKYNVWLSQRRVQSALQYLVDRGIDPSRFQIEHYGEYKLATDCPDGKPCSEPDHQLNRRTEIKILEF